MSDFSTELEKQVRAEVIAILKRYPNTVTYVGETLVDELTELALKMY